jgi:Fur family ferric uptake transcriptional regulator
VATAIFQRSTKQRRVILEELRKLTSHPTAPELYDRVRGRLPRISLSTVYRNLDRLVQQGVVNRIEGGAGQSRYDGDSEPHCHIRCVVCERIEDAPFLPAGVVEQYESRFEDYEVLGSRFEIIGVCPACRQRERTGETGETGETERTERTERTEEGNRS